MSSNGTTLSNVSPALRGMAMVLLATVAWSFAGLLVRLLSIDTWTAIVGRGLASSIMLSVPMLLRRRTAAVHDLVSIGWVGWACVVIFAVAQASTTAALLLTSVAHVTVIYATCPFNAADIAWLWIGEAIPRTTLLAIAGSVSGVLLVVIGATGTSSLLGDAIALLMTASFALLIVLSKVYPGVRMQEVTILSAFLNAIVFLPFASTAGLNVRNGAVVCLYAFTNMVLGFFLFLRGARLIPAATSGLIVTLEIALSPFWVWLFLGETVDRWTLIGGIVVAIAVIGHVLVSVSRQRRGIALAGADTLGAASHA